MAAKFIRRTAITTAMLVSSTRAENDYTAWSDATTYAANDYCISATTHRIYKSVQGSNTNHDPTTDDGTWWTDVGPTNRWAMFDQTVGSVTSQATPLTVVIDTGIITDLVLLDVSASSIRVSATDGAGGASIYDTTYAMGDSSVITDWWSYFYDPITAKSVLVVADLPSYSSMRLTVAITATTTATCGTLTVGTAVELGVLQGGARIGIIDYSRKTTDAYGVTDILERAYAKRIEGDIVLNAELVDYVAVQLATVRATPVVFIGAEGFESLIALGWFRDWYEVLRTGNKAECHFSFEGLT